MNEVTSYPRFSLSDRWEHWVQAVSFTVLAITGLVQKYAFANVSEALIAAMGGIESVRIIHRAAAVILMLAVVYHVGTLGYKLFVRRVRPTIVPGLQDVRAAWQTLMYNLGRSGQKPQQGRYTFEEKFEYWALVWGTAVMILTGFMMWNPIATAQFFPGQFIPAAKAAHGGEALLAVLAVIVWHMYSVHIKHFNRSMFSGYISEEEMLEEHPLELADLKAGVADRSVSPQELNRRRQVYLPVYLVIAAVLLFGIYAFVTFEETAITTVPPAEQVVVFSPLTPTPLPTDIPTRPPPTLSALTWDAGVGAMLEAKCGQCHSAGGALGGLDLSSYQAALGGGSTGPIIVAGEPQSSPLVMLQAAGGHPGQLSGEELNQVRDWIAAGAPEN